MSPGGQLAEKDCAEHAGFVNYAANGRAGLEEFTARRRSQQFIRFRSSDTSSRADRSLIAASWSMFFHEYEIRAALGNYLALREKASQVAVSGLDTEACADLLAPVAEVRSLVDSLAALRQDAGDRVREIRSALREDFDCDIHPRSLRTLHEVLQQVPHVPRPSLGAGDDGTLDAVWVLGDAGLFTAEFLADGMVGCAAVVDRGGFVLRDP